MMIQSFKDLFGKFFAKKNGIKFTISSILTQGCKVASALHGTYFAKQAFLEAKYTEHTENDHGFSLH